MEIQTSRQMCDSIQGAVQRFLGTAELRSVFELWESDRRVFGTSVAVDIKTADGQPFGKFTVHRQNNQSVWGPVQFLTFPHILDLDHITKFQLQIGLIHEMLRKLNEG